VRSSSALLAAAAAAATIAAGSASAFAATPAAATPAVANPGAVSPSLALTASSAGTPEVAAIGKSNSLWYYTKAKGKWTRRELAGKNSVYSGPSIVSGPGTDAAIAVEGPAHELLVYIKEAGHWVKEKAAGKNSAYSVPAIAVEGESAGVAVVGRGHTLVYYWLSSGRWHSKEILSGNRAYSAPSLVIRDSAQASPAEPAGRADIAVEGIGHSLSYLRSGPGGPSHSWTNVVVSPAGAYSAPSLLVLTGTDKGLAALAVQGPHHSLNYFQYESGTTAAQLLGSGWVYSAPALVQNAKDPQRPVEMAWQGGNHSVSLLYYSAGSSGWVNDVISSQTGTVNSAPALAAQGAGPAGQADIVLQGASNTLWFLDAPVPASATLAPQFTALRIGGKSTTYGG
jgi:hypothetical protein